MSPANKSSLVFVTPPFDPFTEKIKPLVHQVRDALPPPAGLKPPAEDPMSYSPLEVVVDILERSYKPFPYILGGTILIVFITIAVAFKAALAPVKMFFTVVLP